LIPTVSPALMGPAGQN